MYARSSRRIVDTFAPNKPDEDGYVPTAHDHPSSGCSIGCSRFFHSLHCAEFTARTSLQPLNESLRASIRNAVPAISEIRSWYVKAMFDVF
jgi:hypothetical protein